MFWPTDRSVLEGIMPENIEKTLTFVRRKHPVNPVSEMMILDGALKDSPCLVMMNAETVRRPVLEKIADWVRNDGGIPVSYTHLDVYKRQSIDRARNEK